MIWKSHYTVTHHRTKTTVILNQWCKLTRNHRMSCSLYWHIQTLASLVSSILFSPFEIKQNYSYHLSFPTVSYNLCFVLIISFTSHSSSGSYQDLTTLKVIQMTFVPFPILLSYYPFLMYLKFDLIFYSSWPERKWSKSFHTCLPHESIRWVNGSPQYYRRHEECNQSRIFTLSSKVSRLHMINFNRYFLCGLSFDIKIIISFF